MNRILKTILLLSTTLFLCSCDKDESDFAGQDSYISVFQLKQGEVTLNAAISPGSIVITAPENLSLTGASVTVLLSEHATIAPSPADIEDWDAAQTFTVTSYNGTKSTYSYTVQRRVLAQDGDVVLLTQADVEALAALELTQLNGSLTVGAAKGADSVYSLEALSGLKTITGDLIINATYAAENLLGLEALERVGSVQLMQTKRLKTVELPKLATVMSGFAVNQALIRTLSCPELVNIDKGLQIINADSLVTMQFDKLQSIVENMTLQAGYSVNKLQSIQFPVLTKVGGNINITNWKEVVTVDMPLLTTATSLSMSSMSKMEHLAMPKLTSTLGGVSLSANAMLVDMNFSSLHTIGADCRISNLPLKNIDGLKALTTVGGELFVSDMNKITGIQGFKALNQVDGRIYLSNWPLFSDATWSGLSNLSSAGGEIVISQIPFKTFTGFALTEAENLSIFGHGITSIEKIDVSGLAIQKKLSVSNITSSFVLKGKQVCDYDLAIDACNLNLEGFETVKGFNYTLYANLQANQTISAVKRVSGDLSVNIYNFKGFSMPNLEEVGGKFTLSTNTGIETVEFPSLRKTGAANLNVAILPTFKLPALQVVDGDFAITTGAYNLDKLADLQMPALTAVNGILSLTGFSNNYFNSKLLNLNGFSALQTVKGVTVAYNMGLVDYSGLQQALSSCPAAAWKVSNNAYNPSYRDMQDGRFVKLGL